MLIDGGKLKKRREEKLAEAEKNNERILIKDKKNPEGKYYHLFSQTHVAYLLGIKIGTYQAIENTNLASPLEKQIVKFIELARHLGFDLIDLVKDDYDLRDKFSHITLKDLKDEDNFNLHLYNLEIKYGRFAVFNTFPSSIYYRDEVPNSLKRYEFLSNISHDNRVTNREFYPINEVLCFAFNICNCRSRDEKITILNKIINVFLRGKDKHGHRNKHLHIFNPEAVNYYHDSPTATVIFDIETVLTPSPTNMYELCIIKSKEITTNIRKYLSFDSDQVLGTDESMQVLQSLKYCLEGDGQISTFVNDLGRSEPKLVSIVTNRLSSDFQELKNKWESVSND